MTPSRIAIAAALAIASLAAQAQTAPAAETQFYGLLDVTARYSTNGNATGQSKAEMTDGVLTGSRLGLRGKHAIGSLSAVYTAEAGFAPDTGTSGQGGRLLGRQLFVGLDGDAGTLLAGRQYTVAHDVLSRFESFAFANNSIMGYQGGNYTGLRYDNTVKYLKNVCPVQLQLGHTFCETAGSAATGSAEALATVYSNRTLSLGGVLQQTKNVTTAYFGATLPAGATQKIIGGGATYQAGPAKIYLGYTGSKLDRGDYKNNVVYAGVNFQATESLQIIASTQADKLKRSTITNGDGTRYTSALMADYFLDKVTDVYVEVDYTKVKDGWVALANNTALGSGNLFGNTSRGGIMAGLRLKF